MESWLTEQANCMVLSWEKAIGQFYPEQLEMWTDPKAHLRMLTEDRNSLSAVSYLDWNKYLVGDALKVIDLGAGSGWLSIMLSKHANVESIYAVDASPYNLNSMLPPLAELMGGNLAKIRPIVGLFTPIPIDNNFFDIAVACAAAHHAPNLAELLDEVYRILKPGGFFLILNEMPLSSWRYALLTTFLWARILRKMVLKQWQPMALSVSESGILLNPFLGDRAYGHWQWHSAIKAAGFSLQVVETPFYPYQHVNYRQETRLTHFVARKAIG